MNPDMEAARALIEESLRQFIASKVALAVRLAEGLAAIPQDGWSEAIQGMAPFMLASGDEPFTVAEALLLAGIGRRARHLQDPAAVDLSDPATQELNRQLSEVWRCIDARALARAQEPA
jgi:hypothetical protein